MNEYSPPLGEFQPPDPGEDIDAKWDAWFAEQEKNGYAVISRDEWKARLNDAATDGYAEGRNDERDELTRLLAWAYRKLSPYSFSKLEDALAMDEIKLLLMHSEPDADAAVQESTSHLRKIS